MIIFEFEEELGHTRRVWWLGCTSIEGPDSEHEDEIYEQLDAQYMGWA